MQRIDESSNTTPLVNAYNAIDRGSINKLWAEPSSQTGDSKREISIKLDLRRPLINNESKNNTDRIKILANLIAFKYFRQWSTADINQQEACLRRIQEITDANPSLGLTVRHLMIYARNRSYLVQRKLPGELDSHLQLVLQSNDESRKFFAYWNEIYPDQTIVGKIIQFIREHLIDRHGGLNAGHEPEYASPYFNF
jgi:hypothetical protein